MRFALSIACVLAACGPLGTRPGRTGAFLHVTIDGNPLPSVSVVVLRSPVPDGAIIRSNDASFTNDDGDVLIPLAPATYSAFVMYGSITVRRDVVVWPGRTTLVVVPLQGYAP